MSSSSRSRSSTPCKDCDASGSCHYDKWNLQSILSTCSAHGQRSGNQKLPACAARPPGFSLCTCCLSRRSSFFYEFNWKAKLPASARPPGFSLCTCCSSRRSLASSTNSMGKLICQPQLDLRDSRFAPFVRADIYIYIYLKLLLRTQ